MGSNRSLTDAYREPVPFIETNGRSLYHERRGAGPPLLYLNGSGATLDASAPIIDAFVGDFDVLAYDQRGIGGR